MAGRRLVMHGGWRLAAGLLVCGWLSAIGFAQAPAPAQAPPQRPGGGQGRPPTASPASQKPPATVTPQTYAPEQIQLGQTRFAAQCGFCHGRDAAGGETGPDLTRSALVAEDVRGDKIGPLVRAGRPDKGMPPLTISDADIAAIVAYIHDAKVKAEANSGGRRSVDVTDLQTGNADAGKRYFEGPGACGSCHQLSGNFATVGARYQGLQLLQRMLYPGSGGGGPRANNPPPPRPTLTVAANGQTFTGKLVYRDEFTITLMGDDGWQRSWTLKNAKVSGEEPLKAHIEQLGKYTDEDMHNVFAYLQTLR